MFHDMPEMIPGAQITEKTHNKIHGSHPGFRNRASDLRTAHHPPPTTTTTPPMQPRPQINGSEHERRTFHIAYSLERDLSHTNS